MRFLHLTLASWSAALVAHAGPGSNSQEGSAPYVPRVLRESKHLRPVLERRQTAQFAQGEPIDNTGKGAPLDGMPSLQLHSTPR